MQPAAASELAALLSKVSSIAAAVGVSGEESRGGGAQGSHGRRRLPVGHIRAILSRAQANTWVRQRIIICLQSACCCWRDGFDFLHLLGLMIDACKQHWQDIAGSQGHVKICSTLLTYASLTLVLQEVRSLHGLASAILSKVGVSSNGTSDDTRSQQPADGQETAEEDSKLQAKSLL